MDVFFCGVVDLNGVFILGNNLGWISFFLIH